YSRAVSGQGVGRQGCDSEVLGRLDGLTCVLPNPEQSRHAWRWRNILRTHDGDTCEPLKVRRVKRQHMSEAMDAHHSDQPRIMDLSAGDPSGEDDLPLRLKPA